MDSPSSDGPRKRGRVACVSCRQAKVKCDFNTVPCSRCAKLDISCSVNASYKRTNKRDKVHELEDDVQALKSLIKRQQIDYGVHEQSSSLPRTDDDTCSTIDSNPLLKASWESDATNIPSLTPQTYIDPDSVKPYSLGNVLLSVNESDTLFAVYFEKYHSHLPILDYTRTAAQYYDISGLLYWTIVSVALRSYPLKADVMTNLIPVLCTHVWTEIGSNRKDLPGVDASNVYEIQALLLLATWPLPNIRFWSDRSLIQSNLALISAMHIGLHRPGFHYEYARNTPNLNECGFQERASTWIACYCLCISLSLEAGHAPLVPLSDWIVNKATSLVPQIHVPQELRHQINIERQANDAFQVLLQMNENPAAIAQEPAFLSHVVDCEKRFGVMYETYQNEMSFVNRTRLLGNILLLQTMFFLADQTLPDARAGLLRVYDTATRIITTLMSEDDINEKMSSAPYVLLRILLRAGFAIVRLRFSTFHVDLNRTTCKVLFDAAVLLLRQMSPNGSKMDQPKRVAEALKVTWRTMEDDPVYLLQDPTLQIRSRLGSSLQYDCLMLYRNAVKASSQPSDQPIGSNTVKLDASLADYGTSQISTPAFEAFLNTDLTWLDDLVEADPLPGTQPQV